MVLLHKEEEYEAALADAKKIKELDAKFPEIDKWCKDLEKLHQAKFEKMKDEVLGNLKSMGNSLLGKFGMSLDNFKMA